MPRAVSRFSVRGNGARLLESAAEYEFHSEYSILIANADDGNSIAHHPLELNHALLSGPGVGGVSDGEVARDLLFDSHTSAGNVGRVSHIGIDLNPADAKQSLDAAGRLAG